MNTDNENKPVAANNGQVNPQAEADKKAVDKNVAEAHRMADEDIANDKDFQAHTRTHDLDEGEIARLGD